MKKRFYSIENRIAAGKFKNSYTVEIVTEEILDAEPVRQTFEGGVYYVSEVHQKITSIKFKNKKTAMEFILGIFRCDTFYNSKKIEHLNFTESIINGDCKVVYSDDFKDAPFTFFKDDYCGYIFTMCGRVIEEYHNANRRPEQGEECWAYLHNKFGYSEEG